MAGVNYPVFNGDEVSHFVGLAYDSNRVRVHAARPGDANFDGVIDASDFNIWNENKYTVGAGWTGGDFNLDGVTDVSDFNIWNEGKFSSLDASVVPEPASIHLICLSLLGLVALKRDARRNRSS